MSTTETNLDLLRAAIARRAGVVLSLPTSTPDAPGDGGPGAGAGPGRFRHYKSRFLADGGDGLWVASVPADPALVGGLVERQAPVGVSFRSGQVKVMFAAPALHAQPDYATGNGVRVGAILLRFPRPDEVCGVQRRRNFRVPVPNPGDLSARLWAISEEAPLREKPLVKSELRCELVDVSVAGLGVVLLAADARLPALRGGERLRIELTLREAAVLLEGRLCYTPRPVPNRHGAFRAGIHFKVLTESRDDRAARIQLDRVVNELQRESIRRKKLGAA